MTFKIRTLVHGETRDKVAISRKHLSNSSNIINSSNSKGHLDKSSRTITTTSKSKSSSSISKMLKQATLELQSTR